jgi:hypothetical protein
MRLTLRTLLAFMDDILDPQDAHDIGQKINRSEYAQGLVRRIRDVLRRRQLTAPDLTGPGAGVDANTVAEYLDNTLPPERVPAVEKVCLDSDPHLAEVAACHQVLSLVLTEAAEIRPESRRRMYGLVEEPVAAPPGDGAERAVSKPRTTEPPSQPMPLTLGGRWVIAAAVVVVALIVVGIVWSLGGFGRGKEQVAQAPLGAPERQEQPAPATSPDAQSQEAERPGEQPALQEPPQDDQAVTPEPEPGAAPQPPTAVVETPEEPSTESATTKETPPEAIEPVETTEPTTAAEPGEPTPAEQEGQPEKQGPVELGQYEAATQVLLLYDARRGQWDRLAPRSRIYSTDRLVALPAYRPRIVLADGDVVEIVGTADAGFYGTEAALLPPSGDAAFGLRLTTGRVVITSGKGQTALDLQFGRAAEGQAQPRWRLCLLEPDSRAGIEYRLIPAVGYQPEHAVTAQATLYVENGRAELIQGDASHALSAPATHVILQQGQDVPAAPVQLADASWISKPTPTRLERIAAESMERQIAVRHEQPQEDEKSVTLSLIEQAYGQEEEVKHLAVQCLAVLGKIDVLAEVLDTAQGEPGEPARREAIDALRYWIARGPDAAEQLRDELIRQRGEEDGQLRYRMLWGYGNGADPGGGAIDELLSLLSHDDLGVRELAAYNLRTLSGGRSYRYHAHKPLAERENEAQRLRALREKGSLLPRLRK